MTDDRQRNNRIVDQEVTEIGFTHDDFAALLDKYDYRFSPGDIVAGTVFSIEPRGALIDIGARTAAYIPIQEMSINRIDSPEEVLQSNETREFFILTDENEDGQLTLSIRRIEYMRAWERVRQLQAEDATVRSAVFATNHGGALVRIEGLRGFIPGSHISTSGSKEDLVGEELPLKFLEVDEDRNRLVLSHRRALVERRMNSLEVGEVVIGTVRGLKPYGAFIDIGSVSGLLHISEISHDHIDTPHSVFNVNDEVKVMIIDLDAERGRIALSTKQLESEPGDMIRNPKLVYEKAEEMAAKYRERMLQQSQPQAAPVEEVGIYEEEPGNLDSSVVSETQTIDSSKNQEKIKQRTSISFPIKCSLNRAANLEIQLIVPGLVDVLRSKLADQVMLDICVTAPSFEIQQRHKALALSTNKYSGEATFALVPKEAGEQLIEIEFFNHAFRVGYSLVKTEVIN